MRMQPKNVVRKEAPQLDGKVRRRIEGPEESHLLTDQLLLEGKHLLEFRAWVLLGLHGETLEEDGYLRVVATAPSVHDSLELFKKTGAMRTGGCSPPAVQDSDKKVALVYQGIDVTLRTTEVRLNVFPSSYMDPDVYVYPACRGNGFGRAADGFALSFAVAG